LRKQEGKHSMNTITTFVTPPPVTFVTPPRVTVGTW
jgi:hypothetical protein